MPPANRRRNEGQFRSPSSHARLMEAIIERSSRISEDDNSSVGTTESPIPMVYRNSQHMQISPLEVRESLPVALASPRSANRLSDIAIVASPGSSKPIRSKLSVQEQKLGLDEAYLMYTRAENAALMIQKKFRDRHPEFAKDIDDRTSNTTDHVSEDSKKEEEEKSRFTLIYLACAMSVPILYEWIMKILSLCSHPADGVVDDGVGASNIAGGGKGVGVGGGVGGGGPNPVQTMAGQAAGAAGTGAAAGVAAAGAVAAGAAGAAAGAAVAGAGVGAAAGASVVGIAAAAAATIVGVSVATGAFDSFVPVSILSACGISNPQVLPGRITFLLEGFYREFDNRETTVLESLLVEAYNNITLGPERNLCQDKYLRELQSATLFNQTFFPQTELNNSYIETSFETITICDGCPSDNPMFGDAAKRRRLQDQFSSGEFFMLFLQRLILRLKELSDDGEIMQGFIQIERGYIVNSLSGKEAMLVEISTTFNKAGDVSTLTLTLTANGETTVTTVNILASIENDDETNTEAPAIAVTIEPTSPYPSMAPSITQEPSMAASLSPSMVPSVSSMPSPVDFSRSPSGSPSMDPTYESRIPSEIPSIIPSEFPLLSLSDAPTKEPTISPTTHQTINFSGQPTRNPSSKPSKSPSRRPSDSPSRLPSVVPSDSPSDSPSSRPSGVPSTNPSNFPSAKPSIGPSMVPSDSPTDSPSRSPSDSPTLRPTKAPTRSPTPKPSRTPTMVPSHSPSTLLPTKSPTRRPSAAPSTSRPSNSPSLRPTRPPTPLPTKAPITPAPSKAPVTLRPTMNPTVRVHPNKTPAPVV